MNASTSNKLKVRVFHTNSSESPGWHWEIKRGGTVLATNPVGVKDRQKLIRTFTRMVGSLGVENYKFVIEEKS